MSKLIKCVLFGPAQSGKTALATRITGQPYPTNYTPTLGATFEKIDGAQKDYSLQIWDVGGQPQWRHITNHYARSANTVIYVVDAQKDLTQQLHEIAGIYQFHAPLLSQNCPIFLVGNKFDDLDQNQHVNELDLLNELAKKTFPGRQIFVYLTSAKNEINIKDVFVKIVTICLEAEQQTALIEEDNKKNQQKIIEGVTQAYQLMKSQQFIQNPYQNFHMNFIQYLNSFKNELEYLNTLYFTMEGPIKSAAIQNVSQQALLLVQAMYGADGNQRPDRLDKTGKAALLKQANDFYNSVLQNFPSHHAYIRKLGGMLTLSVVLITVTTLTGGFALPLMGASLLTSYLLGFAVGLSIFSGGMLTARPFFAEALREDHEANSKRSSIIEPAKNMLLAANSICKL